MTTTTKTKPKPRASRAGATKTGAAALMKTASSAPSAAGELPLELLDPKHFTNPRGDVDEKSEEFLELVASIEANGLLQPIVVGPALVEGGKHPVVAGWRRYHALSRLKTKSAPVRQVTLTESRDALAAAIAENRARQDITPLAEARAIRTLIDEHGMTQVAAAKAIGMSERTVRERLRLLTLPERTAAAIDSGAVPMDAAVNLQKIASIAPELADQLVIESEDPGFSASDLATEQLILGDVLWAAEGHTGRRLVSVAAQHGGPMALAVEVLFGEQADKIRKRLAACAPDGRSWNAPPLTLSDDDLDAAERDGLSIELDNTIFIADEDWIRDRAVAALDRLEQQAAENAAVPAANTPPEDERAADADAEYQARLKRANEIKAWARQADLELGKALQALIPAEVDLGDDAIASIVLPYLHMGGYALGVPSDARRYVDPDFHHERASEEFNTACVDHPARAAAIVLREILALILAAGYNGSEPVHNGRLDDAHIERALELIPERRRALLPERSMRLRAARVLVARERSARKDTLLVLDLLGTLDGLDRAATVEALASNCHMRPETFSVSLERAAAGGLIERGSHEVPEQVLVAITPSGIAACESGPIPQPQLQDIDPPGPPPVATDPTRANKERPKAKRPKAAQVLEIVTAHPGITIPDLAGKLGIQQNFLYRILPELQKNGQVTKEGRAWHATGKPAVAA